ncbi:MAG: DUF4160 domain-containing protein [Phycisphaeraceae bacterium]
MPEISRFYGIIIRMFYNDHAPPHFHVEYAGDRAAITIQTLAVMEGRLPPRAMGLVMEWAAQHQADLLRVWEQARQTQPLDHVEPLV